MASALAAAGLVAGCVPRVAPPPVVSRPSADAPAPAPLPLSSDWRDWPQTPGDWRYQTAGGPTARYMTADDRPLLTLWCDRSRRHVLLTLPSLAAATAMTIRTSSAVRVLPVRARAPADAAPLVMLDAELPASDRLLDAMAFSRGRFTLERIGQPPLVLPAWAEVGRVIEACR